MISRNMHSLCLIFISYNGKNIYVGYNYVTMFALCYVGYISLSGSEIPSFLNNHCSSEIYIPYSGV